MKRLACISVFSALCVTSALVCQAGVIVLRSGEKIKGLITSKDAQSLQISVEGQLRTYPIGDIQEIRGRQPLEQEMRLCSSDEPIDFKTALDYGARGEFLQAQSALEKIVRTDSADPNATQTLYICRQVNNGMLSRDYALCILQGISKMLDDEYVTALALFKKALSRSPRSIDVYYNLGCVYLLMGDDTNAAAYFERLIERDPNNKDILYKLGVSFYSLGKYSKASEYFERLVRLAPDDPDVYAYLGSIYLALDQPEKSGGYLRKAKALFQEQGQFQKAQEADALLK